MSTIFFRLYPLAWAIALVAGLLCSVGLRADDWPQWEDRIAMGYGETPEFSNRSRLVD